MPVKTPAPLNLPHLLAIGMQMAETIAYEDASLAYVAKAAKVPVARLKAHFVDFTHYLIAVQQQFLDELRDDVIATAGQQPPGLERVRLATLVYLDHCLKHRGLRLWLMEERKKEPRLADGLRRQNHSFSLIISTEFHALHWPYPLAAARLYLAAIQEAARLENVKGEPLPYIRDAIWDIARLYTGAISKKS